MEVLKTLKEIEIIYDEKKDTFMDFKNKIAKELKQEAIKWYKKTEDNDLGLAVKNFIEIFFNLTTEDLKNG